MAFIQVIEFRTSDVDALKRAGDDWAESTAGKTTARRVVVGQDRDDPERILQVVFFDSYESAMENSEMAETQAGAAKMAELVDGEIQFRNIDLIDDRKLG